jgi:gamma-glutamyltranspeptidase/glutathione hydrolase
MPARVGIPLLAAALATALASHGQGSLARALGPGIERAKAIAPERARVLADVASRGARAFVDGPLADELVAACGRVARGLLTLEDLASVRPAVHGCASSHAGGRRIATVPWGAEMVRNPNAAAADPAAPITPVDATRTHSVVVSDGRGLVAAAVYDVHLDGVTIAPLGLVAPPTATPVLRGQPRVRPGEPRPAAAPMALGEQDYVDLLAATYGAPDAETTLGRLLEALGTSETLEGALDATATKNVVAVVRSRDAARVITRR